MYPVRYNKYGGVLYLDTLKASWRHIPICRRHDSSLKITQFVHFTLASDEILAA